jgi:H+/Cl- antiporter ClcA
VIRLLQIVFIWLPAVLALFPAYLAVRLQIDWQTNCAGGRAANPGYNVADCWDTERAFIFVIVLSLILLLPAISFGLLRLLARRTAGSGPDQP